MFKWLPVIVFWEVYLGDTSARDEFVCCKVCQWVSDVTHLAQLIVPQSQMVFAALTKYLQGEWVYLQCVSPGCGSLFSDLTDILRTSFLPALFECEIISLEQQLFSLHMKLGRLGLSIPLPLLLTCSLLLLTYSLPLLLTCSLLTTCMLLK